MVREVDIKVDGEVLEVLWDTIGLINWNRVERWEKDEDEPDEFSETYVLKCGLVIERWGTGAGMEGISIKTDKLWVHFVKK